jgi:transcription initiation factor TFIIIB Brf1 subunit/transcription initiation factor TFIIB
MTDKQKLEDLDSIRTNNTHYSRECQFDFDIGYSKTEENNLFGRIGAIENKDQIYELGSKEIQRISEYIDLDENIEHLSKSILNKAIESDLTYNNSIAELSATAVYAVCRTNRIPRSASEIWGGGSVSENKYLPPRVRVYPSSYRNISSFGNIKYAPPTDAGIQLQKLYNKMVEDIEFDIKQVQFTVEDFLERYISLINIESSCIETALVCFQRNKNNLINRSAKFGAAVSLWFIVDNLSLDVNLSDICLVSGHNMQTVSMHKNKLKT